MNLISLFLIVVILLAALEGINRGFLRTALNLGMFFLSVITAFLFYPVVSTAVKANETIFGYLVYYTEGEEKVDTFENSQLAVDSLTDEQIDAIIDRSDTSEPFTSLVRQNIHARVFEEDGLTTIGEYYNMTIVSAVLNILSFLAVFIIARIIFAFVLGAIDYTIQFPELRQYDRISGALFGALRGFLVCVLITTIVPVALLILPVDKIYEYFNDSGLAVFLLENNIFLQLIRGVV